MGQCSAHGRWVLWHSSSDNEIMLKTMLNTVTECFTDVIQASQIIQRYKAARYDKKCVNFAQWLAMSQIY